MVDTGMGLGVVVDPSILEEDKFGQVMEVALKNIEVNTNSADIRHFIGNVYLDAKIGTNKT